MGHTVGTGVWNVRSQGVCFWLLHQINAVHTEFKGKKMIYHQVLRATDENPTSASLEPSIKLQRTNSKKIILDLCKDQAILMSTAVFL